jgi:ribosomal-protein-alanine N-acetyltransferase
MKLDVAKRADAKAMAAVHALAFDAPWSAGDLAALLQSPGVFGVVIRRAEALAAFALARAVADEAEILTLAVATDARRKGLGAALVEAVASRAAAVGVSRLFLEVAADNAAGLALYKRAGFAQAAVRAGYYRRAGGAVDALVLAHDLNRPPA